MFGPAEDVTISVASSADLAGVVTVGVASPADLAGDVTVSGSSPADLARVITVGVSSPADLARDVTVGMSFLTDLVGEVTVSVAFLTDLCPSSADPASIVTAGVALREECEQCNVLPSGVGLSPTYPYIVELKAIVVGTVGTGSPWSLTG